MKLFLIFCNVLGGHNVDSISPFRRYSLNLKFSKLNGGERNLNDPFTTKTFPVGKIQRKEASGKNRLQYLTR